jgi:hypothetical protein
MNRYFVLCLLLSACMVPISSALAADFPSSSRVTLDGQSSFSDHADPSTPPSADDGAAASSSGEAVKSSEPYRVSEISVDVRAENAVKAREKAFEQALADGFQKLCIQLTGDTQTCQAKATPSVPELARVLQDFTTSQEQIAATRYRATYDIRFRPGPSRRLLDTTPVAQGGAALGALGTAIPSLSTSPLKGNNPDGSLNAPSSAPAVASSGILVLPFYQKGNKTVLWAAENPLRDALAQTDMGEGRIKLPLGELEDVQLLDEKQALLFTAADLAPIMNKYTASQAILAIAIPDAQDSSKKGMTVMVYLAPRSAADKPEYLTSYVVQGGGAEGTNHQVLYTQAAAAIRDQAEKWVARAPMRKSQVRETNTAKAETLKTKGQLTVQIVYKDLQEWQRIKARLQATPTISRLKVGRLKTQEARVQIIYSGSETDLLQQLQSRGIQIKAKPTSSAAAVTRSYPPLYSSVADVEPAAGGDDMGPVRYELFLRSFDSGSKKEGWVVSP